MTPKPVKKYFLLPVSEPGTEKTPIIYCDEESANKLRDIFKEVEKEAGTPWCHIQMFELGKATVIENEG